MVHQQQSRGQRGVIPAPATGAPAQRRRAAAPPRPRPAAAAPAAPSAPAAPAPARAAAPGLCPAVSASAGGPPGRPVRPPALRPRGSCAGRGPIAVSQSRREMSQRTSREQKERRGAARVGGVAQGWEPLGERPPPLAGCGEGSAKLICRCARWAGLCRGFGVMSASAHVHPRTYGDSCCGETATQARSAAVLIMRVAKGGEKVGSLSSWWNRSLAAAAAASASASAFSSSASLVAARSRRSSCRRGKRRGVTLHHVRQSFMKRRMSEVVSPRITNVRAFRIASRSASVRPERMSPAACGPAPRRRRVATRL